MPENTETIYSGHLCCMCVVYRPWNPRMLPNRSNTPSTSGAAEKLPFVLY